jgi:hypothetical protein
MWWWGVVAVTGFVALTALVVRLARTNTARSERRRRIAVTAAVRREEAVRRRQAVALVDAWRPPTDGARARLSRALRGRLRRVRAPREGAPHVGLPRIGFPHVGLPHLRLPHIHLPDRVVARLRHRSGGASDEAGMPAQPQQSGPTGRPPD